MQDHYMHTQIVQNWMTPHPITITPQTTLPEAKELMLGYHLRYLPVVNKDTLVGMVTYRNVNRAESLVSSILSTHEINLMQSRLTAREFMSTSLVTISPDSTIEGAAGLMMDHKISGLPVVENATFPNSISYGTRIRKVAGIYSLHH